MCNVVASIRILVGNWLTSISYLTIMPKIVIEIQHLVKATYVIS